jgi:apolipoprotein D and lipocalin family protein
MSHASHFVAALSCLTILLGCSLIRKEPVPGPAVVPHVEIERYLGTWYEIARYPNRFQKECVAVTADYSLRNDGKIRVVNACRKGGLDGPVKSIEGKAWVVDRETNAKLEVQFFWPFRGAYWIIDLGKDYDYAVVGHPNRKYLWILSRKPEMEPALYQAILGRLVAQGYAPARLQKTLQPAS